MVAAIDPQRVENLGPAERILQTLTTFTDHMHHGRPGMVSQTQNGVGARWEPVKWKLDEEGQKVVYVLSKQGLKQIKTRAGILQDDNTVVEEGVVLGTYLKSGLFEQVAVWMYRQVAEVWKMDNEFAAHWASWAFPREHRDLKVILAAFLLVQSRSGKPIREGDEVLFLDDDFRAVGEAMCLIRLKKRDLDPKLLMRVGDVLNLDGVAAINRELGFGRSARSPARGRYYKAVQKWLRYREQNPKMLKGLVKAGFSDKVRQLSRRVGYKPTATAFFEALRWKQSQAKDGRRGVAIGVEVAAAETWEGLTEHDVCERIVQGKPNYKRIVGLLPKGVGLTRAIMAAAVEAGSLSKADLIIMTPTLEELGLLNVASVQAKWKDAMDSAENQRAAHIALNVKSKVAREGLQQAADVAMVKALEEVTRDLRVYVCVDKSASMDGAIDEAVGYLTKFVGGFPLDRLHVSVFNSDGREIQIRAPKAAAVAHAFHGHRAGGGTSYARGFHAIAHHKPLPGEDALVLFVGDEEDYNAGALVAMIRRSGIEPVAFGLLKVQGTGQYASGNGRVVTDAARALGIGCFPIDKKMFDDVYAVTRTLRNCIASVPVGAKAAVRRVARKTLVEEILETPLLVKPVWAA